MVSYGLPLPGQKRGGIERAAHTLAEGLARRDHAVVVFSHDPRPARASYRVRELPWKAFVYAKDGTHTGLLTRVRRADGTVVGLQAAPAAQ